MPQVSEVSRTPLPPYAHEECTDYLKQKAWTACRTLEGKDPAFWRIDKFGALIFYGDHANRGSVYGWEICDQSQQDAGTQGDPGTGDAGLSALHWENHVKQCMKVPSGSA